MGRQQVAVVTGASRGVGRGVAEGLAEAGLCVYLTGRDEAALADAARAVRELGGAATPVRCDHGDDAQTRSLFERVLAEHERIDVLVNSAWGGYENMVEEGEFTWPRPFWEQPLWRWDAMFGAGVRAAYAAAREAARAMVRQRSGLIVNVSSPAARGYGGNVAYGVAKLATDRMSADMAHELRPHSVTVVALYPGLVRTERVMEAAAHFDLTNSESPRFQGRAVVALLRDPERMKRSGEVLLSAQLARDYGFTDVDGSQPEPPARVNQRGNS